MQKLLSITFKVQPHYLIVQYALQPLTKVQQIAMPQRYFHVSLTFLYIECLVSPLFDKPYLSYIISFKYHLLYEVLSNFPPYPVKKSHISSNKL